MKITIQKNKDIFEKYKKVINNGKNEDFLPRIFLLFIATIITFALPSILNNIIEIEKNVNIVNENKIIEGVGTMMENMVTFLFNMTRVSSIVMLGLLLKAIYENNQGAYFNEKYLKKFYNKHKEKTDCGIFEMEKMIKNCEKEKENYIKNIKSNDEKMIDFMFHLKFMKELNEL